jgi:hypothetical protein
VVIAHELGHSMGLVHVTTYESVMKSGNLTVEPQAADAQALIDIWGQCSSSPDAGP